jgi:hypothetical protein
MEQQSERGLGVLAGLEALDRPPIEQRQAPRPPSPPRRMPDERSARPLSRDERSHIRRRGPLVALLIPTLLGATSLLMLRGSTSTGRGVGGFVAAVAAAPLLPAFGAPMRDGTNTYLVAIAASALLWFVLGAWAAQRATRTASGGWGRFWSEYLWLSLCVWVGAALSLVAANLVLGRVLL